LFFGIGCMVMDGGQGVWLRVDSCVFNV